MANGDFGPWGYNGYTIERYLDKTGPVEYIVTKSGGDDIASFESLSAAKDGIDDMIKDCQDFYAGKNVY